MPCALIRLCLSEFASLDTDESGELDAGEFQTEKQRQASGQPRWASLLQKAELEQLADACPGAASLDGIRKACVGYFIAE